MKIKGLYPLFFFISLFSFLAFWVFLFLAKSDAAAWRGFSVFMPMCGGGLLVGMILLAAEKLGGGAERRLPISAGAAAAAVLCAILLLTVMNLVQ